MSQRFTLKDDHETVRLLLILREKRILDLEARNAELKQQLWMVEAEVDSLR